MKICKAMIVIKTSIFPASKDGVFNELQKLKLLQYMKEMLELLTMQGYKKASLAVQKANYAVKMYEKVGFEVADENDEEFIMVCNL